MSAGVSEYQKNKGQGILGKPLNSKLPNGPKEHYNVNSQDRDDLDSWRNNQHHQGYSGMGGATDAYMPSYYGSFQYATGPSFGVNEGPWSNGGDMGFVGGYAAGGMRESGGPSGHYNNMDGGLFGSGTSGGFGNFGNQPGIGYGFHGNATGDYNAWGQPRKSAYEDYYRSRDGMYGEGLNVVDGMGGLSLTEKELKDMSGGGSKKTTWATIASQPAKPQSFSKKKSGMLGMPPPPVVLGTWEKNGTIPKAQLAAPVQAPNPPAWERMDRVPKMAPPPGPMPSQVQTQQVPPMCGPPPLGNRSGSGAYQGGQQLNYMNLPPQQSHHHHHQQLPVPPPPPQPNSLSRNSTSSPGTGSNTTEHHTEPIPVPPSDKHGTPPSSQYPPPAKSKSSSNETRSKSDYNPTHFELSADGARFFVIKSYSEDDIHRSIKYEIWCSTENGNKRLDDAWREREGKGCIYLFFSVNASGHFCGMAQMMSGVDHEASSSVWCQDKWKGQFKVKWIYVKDVPNPALRHIRLENNENKAVTNSRDTQEVPYEKGKLVLKIIHSFQHVTSIFDDFVHYEKKQEEEDLRRTQVPSGYSPHDRADHRGERGRGRGSGYGSGMGHGNNDRDREHRNPRDRDNHPRERDSHFERQDNSSHGRGIRGGGYGSNSRAELFGGGFDRGDRDFYRDRSARGDRTQDSRR